MGYDDTCDTVGPKFLVFLFIISVCNGFLLINAERQYNQQTQPNLLVKL